MTLDAVKQTGAFRRKWPQAARKRGARWERVCNAVDKSEFGAETRRGLGCALILQGCKGQ